MRTNRAQGHICARLGQTGEYGRVDVCKEAEGHEGPHRGRYHGMVWEDVPGRRDRAQVISPGGSAIPETGGQIRGQ